MKPSEFAEQVVLAGRREHQSRKTWEQYGMWARRFGLWLMRRRELHDCAPELKVSNILDILPPKLRDEVMEDAEAALIAAEEEQP